MQELNFEKLPRFKNESVRIWSLIPQWAHAYQVSNEVIISQLYTAHAWIDSNPKRAPKKLVTRFLWSWMGQAKKYGNLRTPDKIKPRVAEPEPEMSYEEMVAIRKANMEKPHVQSH
jgi:hypothetical protein